MLSINAMACRTSSVAECAVRLFKMMEHVTEFGCMPIVHLTNQSPHFLAIFRVHKGVQHLVVRDLVRLDVVLGHLRKQRASLRDLADLQVSLEERVVAHDIDETKILHLLEVLQRDVHLPALHA
jgi:hypothetical protein